VKLLVQQLQTMLWVEETLAGEVLPELFETVGSPELRYDVEKHILETQGHAQNLRVVLARVDARADPEPSPVLPALRAEHAALLQGTPEPLRDLVHAGAIARTEHYEVAAYSGLAHLAQALGLELDLVRLLRENMEQDAYALEQVEHALAKLLAERVSATFA
jgi:ferritin-like metal-binding protein YciE